MLNIFYREARLSPYAVSTHTYGGTKSNRPKSAVLSQREKPKRSTGPPQTVIGWSEKADWTSEQQQPKKRNRPVSAPATRNRLITSKLNRRNYIDSRSYLRNHTLAKNLKKKSGLNGIRTHDLCNVDAVLYQLSYQANWEQVMF